jgi:4-hydroxybenzoate polyprenyltransferase
VLNNRTCPIPFPGMCDFAYNPELGISTLRDNIIQVLLFGLYFLIPANIRIYGINDIYDYETDKLNPKKVE